MKRITRQSFLWHSLLSSTGLALFPRLLASQAPQKQEKGPPLDPALVKAFVGAAHNDFDKVKTMLAETPALLNSVNNPGSWDWEDAIGAAGHVGHREMATFLLEKGGRLTICVAAMLGKVEIVKSSITAFPYLKDAVGPHNISLLRHAKSGGEEARAVVEYLKALGAKE